MKVSVLTINDDVIEFNSVKRVTYYKLNNGEQQIAIFYRNGKTYNHVEQVSRQCFADCEIRFISTTE